MSASARVELDRLADVLVVPTGAVFQRGAATVVYVVNGGVDREPAGHRAAARTRSDRDRVRASAKASASSLKEPERAGAAK